MYKGQQTLSEEVGERTRSRLLRLEKENQSLLRAVEDLRSLQPKHSRHEGEHVCKVAFSTDSCTSSTDNLSGSQTSCSHVENHTNVDPNQDSNCHQQPDTEDLHTDNPDLHAQEKGERFRELMSDMEVLENNHNRLHCLMASHEHPPGLKRSSPSQDSIFTGLPARSCYASKQTQRLEAKCRALDSANQHLQASLDSTGTDH